MESDFFLRRKAEIEAANGPWTAHNCQLSQDIWTLREGPVNFDEKMRRALQIAHDFFGPDLAGLEVLDLGALEGALSLEFAAQGAKVACVEGRKQNLIKAQFTAEALGLSRIDFIRRDVRTLDFGARRFDLILCYGLLYHLDGPSAVALVRKTEQWTRRLLILDTHFSLTGTEIVQFEGHTYHGRSYREHNEGVSAEDYWDRGSEILRKYRDRSVFVAVKSVTAEVRTSPKVNEIPPRTIPEDIDDQLIDFLPS